MSIRRDAFGKDLFGDGRADRDHGFVHHLAEAQMHGDTAQDVGVHVGETPDAHQQIDHARRGVAGGAKRVFVGFDHDPGFGNWFDHGVMRKSGDTDRRARTWQQDNCRRGAGGAGSTIPQRGQPLFRSLLGGHCGSLYHGTIFPSAGVGVV